MRRGMGSVNMWQIAVTGVGAYSAAIVGSCLWLKWRDRKKLPMPVLQVPQRNPAHERPDRPLTDCEEIRFGVLWDSYYHLEAADPMEQSGDR